MSEPDPLISAWIRKAEHDVLNIENNLAAQEIPWDTICFHAQQAAEKLLKVFLIAQGQEVQRTHDLVAILSECVKITSTLSLLEADCRKLTYFAVSGRYPDDIFEPDEQDGRDMVEALHRLRSALLPLLMKRE
jgi:HEPN domain-containing protein